eukprot:m.446509 g.446509  ORF g.446509 m.446509 type:complete len:613 (+) comp21497_c0_seq66:275-2113(+)
MMYIAYQDFIVMCTLLLPLPRVGSEGKLADQRSQIRQEPNLTLTVYTQLNTSHGCSMDPGMIASDLGTRCNVCTNASAHSLELGAALSFCFLDCNDLNGGLNTNTFFYNCSSGCERSSCSTISRDLFECNALLTVREAHVKFDRSVFHSRCASRYTPESQPVPPTTFFISEFPNTSSTCDKESALSTAVTKAYEIPRSPGACVLDAYRHYYRMQVKYKGVARNEPHFTGVANCEDESCAPENCALHFTDTISGGCTVGHGASKCWGLLDVSLGIFSSDSTMIEVYMRIFFNTGYVITGCAPVAPVLISLFNHSTGASRDSAEVNVNLLLICVLLHQIISDARVEESQSMCAASADVGVTSFLAYCNECKHGVNLLPRDTGAALRSYMLNCSVYDDTFFVNDFVYGCNEDCTAGCRTVQNDPTACNPLQTVNRTFLELGNSWSNEECVNLHAYLNADVIAVAILTEFLDTSKETTQCNFSSDSTYSLTQPLPIYAVNGSATCARDSNGMYYNLTISTSPVAYGGNVLNGVIFCSDGDCQDNCVHLVPNCTAADCMVGRNNQSFTVYTCVPPAASPGGKSSVFVTELLAVAVLVVIAAGVLAVHTCIGQIIAYA